MIGLLAILSKVLQWTFDRFRGNFIVVSLTVKFN